MSYYSIVSTTAVVTGHTKVNDIHNVWSFTVCTASMKYSTNSVI